MKLISVPTVIFLSSSLYALGILALSNNDTALEEYGKCQLSDDCEAALGAVAACVNDHLPTESTEQCACAKAGLEAKWNACYKCIDAIGDPEIREMKSWEEFCFQESANPEPTTSAASGSDSTFGSGSTTGSGAQPSATKTTNGAQGYGSVGVGLSIGILGVFVLSFIGI